MKSTSHSYHFISNRFFFYSHDGIFFKKANRKPIKTKEFIISKTFSSTNDKQAIFFKLVRWNFEVERCRAFPNPSRCVVVGSVARAVVAAEIAGVCDRDTALKRKKRFRFRFFHENVVNCFNRGVMVLVQIGPKTILKKK